MSTEHKENTENEVGEEHTNYIKTDLGEMNVIESMCPKCQENGTTRLMITTIPHFKQIIVSSFDCPHCGESNNEVTFGGQFGPKKVRYELEVKDPKDMDRQIVKSEFATLTIPELELEIPPESQKGSLNTVEGVLEQTKDGLQFQQPLRKVQHPELYEQIEGFCQKLEEYRSGTVPFTLVLDDPAGNSYIEGRYDYYHPTKDPQLTKYEKERTEIDRQLLGVSIDYNTERTREEEQEVEDGHFGDISAIPSDCPACAKMGQINVHQCDIPHFKETIIMAFKCDHCGYRSNEIKSGGAISEKGKRITLHVETDDDLKRDVLKSETATLIIPEVCLELAPGTLGGFFSTIEGSITQVRDQLQSLPQVAFSVGDSASGERTMLQFVEELNKLIALEKSVYLCPGRPAFEYLHTEPQGAPTAPGRRGPQADHGGVRTHV
ncbi:zinc-finger protein ZPR1 [Angomonas deanei]|nr:zinc-finger protein ZPR1 [Angomonas deanei]|eukprot:EPY25194.1 zinc-finger protein ZPR1 [Angomonas deanei]